MKEVWQEFLTLKRGGDDLSDAKYYYFQRYVGTVTQDNQVRNGDDNDSSSDASDASDWVDKKVPIGSWTPLPWWVLYTFPMRLPLKLSKKPSACLKNSLQSHWRKNRR